METNNLERAILGLAMQSPRALFDLDGLRPDHFQQVQTRAVWQLIQAMSAEAEPITAQTVFAGLKRIPEMERRGVDAIWLFDCVRSAPALVNAENYAKQLINQADLLQLRNAVSRSAQIVDATADAATAIELVRGLVDGVAPETVKGSMLADTLPQSIARFDEESLSMPTPWRLLDQVIGGWRPGALYVVGARPGAGKTIFAVQAALGLAQYGAVAFNTLEMSVHEVNQRIIAHAANVFISKLQGTGPTQAKLTPQDRENIQQASTWLMDLPLSIRDDRNVTPLGVRSHARSLSRRQHLAGIVVDYLQIMMQHSADRRPRHEIVADYSRALKNLAGEMECPVIALSQLNRGAAGSQPSLANLRESGSLEQDADVVILLSLPEDKREDGEIVVDEARIKIEVAKNRHGPLGSFIIQRVGGKSTIGDLNRF